MALIDGYQNPVTVRLEVAPATGSTTSIPASPPYNMILFTNPGTIAAQTVVLPLNPVDGQVFTICNLAAITALSLTPAISGFTNASALTAGQGLTAGYSATMATPGWFAIAV